MLAFFRIFLFPPFCQDRMVDWIPSEGRNPFRMGSSPQMESNLPFYPGKKAEPRIFWKMRAYLPLTMDQFYFFGNFLFLHFFRIWAVFAFSCHSCIYVWFVGRRLLCGANVSFLCAKAASHLKRFWRWLHLVFPKSQQCDKSNYILGTLQRGEVRHKRCPPRSLCHCQSRRRWSQEAQLSKAIG